MELITVARKPFTGTVANNVLEHGTGAINIDGCRVGTDENLGRAAHESKGWKNTSGMTGSMNDDWKKGRWPANLIHDGSDEVTALFPGSSAFAPRNDRGSAARFFYCAKASKKDRGEGNSHPTVKPTDLMAYLVRLVTPPGGVLLDPFMGSGSTGKACKREGFDFIGCDLDPDFVELARKRIENA